MDAANFTPPPRGADEPDATTHQIKHLQTLGYDDPVYLANLGCKQANWLIDKEHDVTRASHAAGGKKERSSRAAGSLLVVIALLAGFYYFGGEWLVKEEGLTPATPESQQEKTTLDTVKETLAGLTHKGRQRAAEKSATDPTSPSRRGTPPHHVIEVGKSYILQKPVGVRVKEGVVVLQPGTVLNITSNNAGKVTFEHPLGLAEATLNDLLPAAVDAPSPAATPF